MLSKIYCERFEKANSKLKDMSHQKRLKIKPPRFDFSKIKEVHWDKEKDNILKMTSTSHFTVGQGVDIFQNLKLKITYSVRIV